LFFDGKNTSACSDKGFDTETFRPGAQIDGRKFGEQLLPPLGGIAIPLGKIFKRFRVSEIKSSSSRDEKFAPHGGHAIDQNGFQACGGNHLCGTQSRRTTTDD